MRTDTSNKELDSSITISIILCTHNRRGYLEKAAKSLLAQFYPAEEYEIVIVDNASTDGTQAFVAGILQDDCPPIRYIYEPTLGLSQARNTGFENAKGNFIVYIDDDAVAEPDWLAALVKPFTNDEHVVCVGGKVKLLWEVPEPDWMPKEFYGLLGDNTAWGDIPHELPISKTPHEGNMAIRKEALLQTDGFNTQLGRTGKKLTGGEGARLMDQLRQLGICVYEPEAVIHHFVPATRATKGYLTRRGFWEGTSSANLAQIRSSRSRIELIRLAAANAVILIKDFFLMVKNWLLRNQRQAFIFRVYLATRAGKIWQTIMLALSR